MICRREIHKMHSAVGGFVEFLIPRKEMCAVHSWPSANKSSAGSKIPCTVLRASQYEISLK